MTGEPHPLPAPDPRRRLGQHGEALAAEHLIRRGYRILDRNYRLASGELDLVAADARTIVFCEVKTRRVAPGAPAVDPLQSVHPRKQQKVRRLAARWLAEHADRPRVAELRFDAIGVVLDPGGRLLALDHLEGAF
jgi:putative endonuclease